MSLNLGLPSTEDNLSPENFRSSDSENPTSKSGKTLDMPSVVDSSAAAIRRIAEKGKL